MSTHVHLLSNCFHTFPGFGHFQCINRKKDVKASSLRFLQDFLSREFKILFSFVQLNRNFLGSGPSETLIWLIFTSKEKTGGSISNPIRIFDSEFSKIFLDLA